MTRLGTCAHTFEVQELFEVKADAQKRPANGREHVGRHEDTTQEVGSADEANNAPTPAPLRST